MNDFGLPAASFAVKTFISAMLAFYIALAIGLDRPYWAVTTAFIVAQPVAGAALSRGLFRAVGTVIGAVVAVVLVPNLVDTPELLIMGLASWLGLCVFAAILERTPRAYMFTQAGAAACLIAVPSMETPGQVFDFGILRVEEILLGVGCASLVHGVVFPTSASNILLRRVDATLHDAERWSAASMKLPHDPHIDVERQRLALDITEMHQLSILLPFDLARVVPRTRIVRALQDQLSQILPLSAAVEDRLSTLAQSGVALPATIARFLDDCRTWLANPGTDGGVPRIRVEELCDRARALEPTINIPFSWDDSLLLNLLVRLSSLMAAHRDARDLRDQLVAATDQPITPRVAQLTAGRAGRELNRDYAAATRAGIAAALTIVLGCTFWIMSAWKDGATAVMLCGVFMALFAAQDDPTVPMRRFLIGTVIATLIGAIYGFILMPRIDGFPMLAAILAPALLLGGALMAHPTTAVAATAAMVGLASPVLIASRYQDDFAGYVNGSIAQLAALLFALLMTRLVGSAGLRSALRRTLRAGWNDIATRGIFVATSASASGWSSRMIDRLAILSGQLSALGQDPAKMLFHLLRDLRVGVILGDLRDLRSMVSGDDADSIAQVLERIGAYFRGLDPARPREPTTDLLDAIDLARSRLEANTSPNVRRAASLALVSLRRNLFPEAVPHERPAA